MLQNVIAEAERKLVQLRKSSTWTGWVSQGLIPRQEAVNRIREVGLIDVRISQLRSSTLPEALAEAQGLNKRLDQLIVRAKARPPREGSSVAWKNRPYNGGKRYGK